jgi:hypothetical protein
MRERRLAELELQAIDWYSVLEEPRRPLDGAEGERLLRREAARIQRYGGVLSVIALQLDPSRGQAAIERSGALVASTVRDCDFVSEGGRAEFLIGLPNCDSAGARVCARRLLEQLGELPWRAPVTAGVAELGENELVDDTVARARREAVASEHDSALW